MKESPSNETRVAFITGVSRGIGRAMFIQCARMKGVNVIGVARSKEAIDSLSAECDEQGGSGYHLYTHDLNETELPSDLLNRIESLGRIDVLINNAGYLVNKSFKEITYQDWLDCYQTNVYVPFRLSQQLHPYLSESRLAHVVNIGSMGGVQGSSKFPGLSAYSSSKAALIGLTECLAEEWKDTNIRINTVNLGAVQTEMLAEAFPGYVPDHQPAEIAEWLLNFAFESGKLMNGKSVFLSDSTP